MSRKKSKKAIKKVVSSGVRRVPSAFDDNLFVEAASQKGSHFWPSLRFNFRENCLSGSENEFVDIDSFSDAAPEVQKEVVPDATAEPPVTATAVAVSQSVHPHNEASPEFTKELELTVHRGENPVPDAPLVEVRKALPEGRDPSPSVAAFNKSFDTLYHGELLSVGYEVSALIDETGEEGSEQSLHSLGGAVRDSRKEPRSSSQKTPASLGKPTSGSGKKVTLQNLSRQGSIIFVNFCTFQIYEFLLKILVMEFFQNLRTFFVRTLHPRWRSFMK
jgi:hypothetical protein